MQGTATKRQKEQARLEHRNKKKEAKQVRKKEKETRGPREAGGVDPDIAGIVPGPQPLPEI